MKVKKSQASRIALTAGASRGNGHGRSAKPELVHASSGASPESVIPLDDDDFKEF
jgi:hypothetical protein